MPQGNTPQQSQPRWGGAPSLGTWSFLLTSPHLSEEIIYWGLLCPQDCTKHFGWIISFSPYSKPQSRYYSLPRPHVRNRGTTGLSACLRLKASKRQAGFEPRSNSKDCHFQWLYLPPWKGIQADHKNIADPWIMFKFPIPEDVLTCKQSSLLFLYFRHHQLYVPKGSGSGRTPALVAIFSPECPLNLLSFCSSINHGLIFWQSYCFICYGLWKR